MSADRDHAAAPIGTWRIDSIDDRPSRADRDATIELHEDGRVAGSTGLNRFAGAWTIEGGVLTVGPLATTLMAGPPELMEQERRVLEILGAPLTATRDAGALRLDGAAGPLDLTRVAADPGAGETKRRVAGTATYRERIAPPHGAVLTVRVEDVSLVDVPAPVLAEESYDVAAVPVAFELFVDPGAIDEARHYAVRAEIRDGERLRWTTDTVFPVLTQDAPETSDLILVAVPSDRPGP
jgi:uncharacterized lipoprotein YbaY